MRRLKNHRAASPRSLHLKPPCRANTPSISWLEPFKTKLWPGRRQIVAQFLGDLKKSLIDHTADRVNPQIVRARLTASRAVKASHWLTTARAQRLPQNILPSRLYWFHTRHRKSDL